MIRGDGSNFFGAAANKSLTCYGVVNGKPTTYQAKPDVNGVLTCSHAQQTAGGSSACVGLRCICYRFPEQFPVIATCLQQA